MVPSWCRQTVIRLRPTMRQSRGSSIPDWTDPDRLEIKNCSVQPAATGLSLDGRVLGLFEGYTVYMPPGTDVRAGDRIEYDGNVYTINGEPKAWTSPTGRVSHIQLNIERWAG